MMPPEGPKHSEELLQRYAQERRKQGGDFALHPATRRLLQGEVARQHGAAGTSSRASGWLGAWWARLALGAAAAVIVGVVMVQSGLFRASTSQPVQMAKSEGIAVQKDFSDLALMRDESNPRLAEKKVEVAVELLARQTGAVGEKQKEVVVDRLSVSGSLQPVPSATPSQPTGFGAAIATANGPVADRYALAGPSGGGGGGADSKSAALVLADGAVELKQDRPLLLATTAPNPTPASRALAPAAPAPVAASRAESLAFGEAAASDNRAAGSAESNARFYRTRAPATPASALVTDGTVPSTSNLGRTEQKQEATRFRRLDAAESESLTKMKVAGDVVNASSGLATRPAPPVLDGFLVEQTGTTIRLLDGDGSVYEGAMEATTAGYKASDFDADGLVREVPGELSKTLADKTVALKSAAPRRAVSSSFRASGTNRTSGQRVVVSGRMGGAGQTNLSALRSSSISGGEQAGAASAVAPVTAPAGTVSFFNGGVGGFGTNVATNGVLEIEGTMRVGESTWQWFRAVQAPR